MSGENNEETKSLDDSVVGLEGMGQEDQGKKRYNIACAKCRSKHTKCDGTGPPCTKCVAGNYICEYIEPDKKIAISMKYLNKLHNEISKLKIENAILRNSVKRSGSVASGANESEADSRPISPEDRTKGSSLENNNEGLSRPTPSGLNNFVGGDNNGTISTNEPTIDTNITNNKSKDTGNEIIPPFLDKYGRMIHSRTGERFYIGASSMTLFGLEINKILNPDQGKQEIESPTNLLASDMKELSRDSASGSSDTAKTSDVLALNGETVLEREGNAYRIMLGKTKSRPGMNVNFTLPSYSYAMLLVDTFISYNDGCFYFFNEGIIKENLRRIFNDETFKPDYGVEADLVTPESESILETIFFCKLLLIFAIGEMYLGTANSLNGFKINGKSNGSNSGRQSKKSNKDKQKGSGHSSNNRQSTKLPGSGFFNEASDLFTGLFSSGAIDNCAREGGIEVLLLYAFYLQVADCTLASYFYFGIALRTSLMLGYHVDIGRESLNRYELEHRRRIWWTVYMYDRMLASKAGLPLSVTDEDISSELPEDFDMGDPPKGCENYIFPEAEFIKNCVRITKINADILRKLYTKQPSNNILPVVHELVVSLLKWKKTLPEYISVDYQQPEIKISRLVVNMMTEYFQGINLAVRPLLFHFALLQLRSSNPKRNEFLDLSEYSPVVLTLLNASFQASVNSIRSLWALIPENMVALFGYMDREYLFTSTATLILFNATFGVHEATTQHIDHALMMFTKMRNLGNHPAALRREQLLKLLAILDFSGTMSDMIKKYTDNLFPPSFHVHDKAKDSASPGPSNYDPDAMANKSTTTTAEALANEYKKRKLEEGQGSTPMDYQHQLHQEQQAQQFYMLQHQQNLHQRQHQPQHNQHLQGVPQGQGQDQNRMYPIQQSQHVQQHDDHNMQPYGLQDQSHTGSYQSFGRFPNQNSTQNMQQYAMSGSSHQYLPHTNMPQSHFMLSEHNTSASPNQQFFSPALIPALGTHSLEDVDDFENVLGSASDDIQLWKDISSQAVWLAPDVGDEFHSLVNHSHTPQSQQQGDNQRRH